VVCGAGPGSFTSLRIAASIAKGIAFARSVPLHAVSSLVLLVAGLEPLPGAGRYLGILDALRGESYAQLVEVRSGAGAVLAAGEPMLVATESIAATARALEAVTVGPGGAIDAVPHARGVGNLLGAIHASRPVDLASWEPDYGRMAEAQVRWEAVHGRPLPQE
jgi:tRNA threonylcarbamoyladenosine biosynthesis protein TsaB